MEIKIDVPVQEQKCLMMDYATGEMFVSTKEQLERMQKELNDKLFSGRGLSMMNIYENMTKDWPEEQREKFLNDLKKYDGWTCNQPVSGIQLSTTRNEEGTIIVSFDQIF